jgi:hypothetical protein
LRSNESNLDTNNDPPKTSRQYQCCYYYLVYHIQSPKCCYFLVLVLFCCYYSIIYSTEYECYYNSVCLNTRMLQSNMQSFNSYSNGKSSSKCCDKFIHVSFYSYHHMMFSQIRRIDKNWKEWDRLYRYNRC